nr:HepT-like ribonuclease domain-containing protein [Leptolyngbya sp. FACHB-711]
MALLQETRQQIIATLTALASDKMWQDAIERNLEVISKATKRTSQTLKTAHPQIPQKQIAGMRNLLIHDSGRVDFQKVWQVIEQDLAEFKVNPLAILYQLSE